MSHDLDDDCYEPEHDQYLDSGEELDEMFGDELAEEGSSSDDEDYDLDDEYHSGLDEDY